MGSLVRGSHKADNIVLLGVGRYKWYQSHLVTSGHVILKYCMPDENVRNLRGGVCNIPIPYWEEMNNSH
jgi:hypothetical protein